MAHFRKRCLTILLSNECNLKCKYCYCDASEDNKIEISMNFVKRAIKDFYKQEGYLFVRFFGNGEPTLKYNKIKEIVEFCKKCDTDSKFELQTNGTFNTEICRWFTQNIPIVWISYDGTTELNDFYRTDKYGKPVSEIVEANIKYMSTRVETLGIRATIGRKNIDMQKQIILKMKELGVKYIYSDLMFASVENKYYYEKPILPMEYAEKFIEARRFAKDLGIQYGSLFTINFDEKTDIFCRACIPMPHLTTDNYISCCDMGYKYTKRLDELFYAKYDELKDVIKYDQKKIKNIANRTVDALDECNDCPAKYHCAGGCIGEAINEKGTIYSVKTQNCEAIRFIYEKIGHEYINHKSILHP